MATFGGMSFNGGTSGGGMSFGGGGMGGGNPFAGGGATSSGGMGGGSNPFAGGGATSSGGMGGGSNPFAGGGAMGSGGNATSFNGTWEWDFGTNNPAPSQGNPYVGGGAGQNPEAVPETASSVSLVVVGVACLLWSRFNNPRGKSPSKA